MPRTYQIGETERIDLGNGYVVEKRHTDVGIDVDVRHLGVSIKTMRYAADLRRLTIDIVLLLLRQRDVAREEMRAAKAISNRTAPSATTESSVPVSRTQTPAYDFSICAAVFFFAVGFALGTIYV